MSLVSGYQIIQSGVVKSLDDRLNQFSLGAQDISGAALTLRPISVERMNDITKEWEQLESDNGVWQLEPGIYLMSSTIAFSAEAFKHLVFLVTGSMLSPPTIASVSASPMRLPNGRVLFYVHVVANTTLSRETVVGELLAHEMPTISVTRNFDPHNMQYSASKDYV